MKLKYLVLVMLCGASLGVGAQDFHNSYFQFAPLTINSALTGAYYGNLRVSVIGRDQGRPVAGNNNEFKDLSLSLDGNLDFGFSKGDWVSFGINNVQSDAGIANFRRKFSGLALAYHLAYGKRKNKVFSVGFKYGSYSTGVNNRELDQYTDPWRLENGGISADVANILGQNSGPDLPTKKTSSYMLGFMLTTPVNKKSDIRIGIASDHILQPELRPAVRDTNAITPNPNGPILRQEDLNRRINAFVYYYTSLNSKWTFNPNLLIQRSGVSTNIVVQGLFTYLYDPKKEISFTAGIGARLVNSMDLPIYLGVDVNSWRVGVSYDANIGGLRPSDGTFGALEIGISKIFSWVKKPVVKPVFICPRL